MAPVERFPPLPPIPRPPEVPDERQRTFQRLTGRMTRALFDHPEESHAINTTFGFRASAVDLGALQDVLERAVQRFDMSRVRQRWDDDLSGWMRRAILSWVQRCKLLQMSIEERGVRIMLETQDDRGYYRYEFDVFPGRKLTVEGEDS